MMPATHGGKKYFFLMVDDYSRYMWVVFLRSKDEAFEAFKKLKAATEMEHKLKVRALWIDRGGEFTSNEFNDYCEKISIKRFLTAPYTPQQNGVIERRNRTVVDTARSLLKSKNMPGAFWGEAVTTAVYLLNRAPTKVVIGKTLYEAIYRRKPNVSHL
jgi:transposase InsO family protein